MSPELVIEIREIREILRQIAVELKRHNDREERIWEQPRPFQT